MHYKLIPTRKRKARNNDILQGKYPQSRKITIEYQRDTTISEDIFLELTKTMKIFQSNKCYI